MPINAETITAITGALGGGFVVKLIDRHYQFREKAMDVSTTIRAELHQRIMELLVELKDAKKTSDDWQAKYFTLFEATALMRAADIASHSHMRKHGDTEKHT